MHEHTHDFTEKTATPITLERLRTIWMNHHGSWHSPLKGYWMIPEANVVAAVSAILAALDAARPVEPQPEIGNWSTISDEDAAGLARRLRKLADINRDELGAKLDMRTAALIERQQAEIERLTRGRDEWEQRTGDAINDEAVQIVRAEKAEAEVADLRAKLAKAVEALEVGTNDMSRAHESLEGSGAYLTRDDLRASMTRARTALDAIKEDRT